MSDSTWTWMSGSNTTEQPSVYGEKGIASADNNPGSRSNAVGWYDSLREEFWLFGGLGFGNDTAAILPGAWVIVGECSTNNPLNVSNRPLK